MIVAEIKRCMYSDLSKIEVFPAIITSLNLIGERALNLQMAVLRFTNVTEEEINALEGNLVPNSTKDSIKFGVTFFKSKI